nr:hypothetical protein [candidate division Zixibacteria bacterium]
MSKGKKTGAAKPEPHPKTEKPPLEINIIFWFGAVLAATYLIWGSISIILSILDRTYKDFQQNLVILVYGFIVLTMAIGFRNKRLWGWYGLLAVMSFVVVWSAFKYTDIYGIIWGLLAIFGLVGILLPQVRKHYFKA